MLKKFSYVYVKEEERSPLIPVNIDQCEVTKDMKRSDKLALELVELGRIEWSNPHFHSEKVILPVGYKVKRKVTPKNSEKKVLYTIEILAPASSNSEPECSVKIDDDVQFTGTATSAQMGDFLEAVNFKTKVSSFLDKEFAKFLGLSRQRIHQNICLLPEANKCSKAKVTVSKHRNMAKQNGNSDVNQLLIEMEDCQLPDGIQAFEMANQRPFECQVCGELDEDEEDFILQCDNCKSCVHMSCYSVKDAPHGRLWLCDVCSINSDAEERPACAVCPIRGGALKRTTCGKWCHPACALWLPEMMLIPDQTFGHLRGLIAGINGIHKSRFTKCCICKQTYGACVQCCSEEGCYKAFHFMCAKNNNCSVQMLLESDDEDGPETNGEEHVKKKRRTSKFNTGTKVSGTRLTVNCPKHSILIRSPRPMLSASACTSSDANTTIRCFSSSTITEWRDHKDQLKKSLYIEPCAIQLGGPSGSKQSSKIVTDTSSVCHTFNFKGHGARQVSIDVVAPDYKGKTGKSFMTSLAEKYFQMHQTWQKSVVPGKSAIHGWGAFAARKFEKGRSICFFGRLRFDQSLTRTLCIIFV